MSNQIKSRTLGICGGVVAIIGGGFLILGSFLDWFTDIYPNPNIRGFTELPGSVFPYLWVVPISGIISILTGILSIVFSASGAATNLRAKRILCDVIPFIFALLSLLVAVIFLFDFPRYVEVYDKQPYDEFLAKEFNALAIGWFFTVVGSILGIIGALWAGNALEPLPLAPPPPQPVIQPIYVPQSEPKRVCLSCGIQIDISFNVCPHCGTPVVKTPPPPPPHVESHHKEKFELTCPNCNKHVDPEWVTCPHCSTNLT